MIQDRFELRKVWIFSGLALLVLGVWMLFPHVAHAASTNGPLEDVYTNLTEWTQGNVGKTIALGMILVGIVAGIARQSLMAFAVGIGAGLGLYNAGTIIDTIFQATLIPGMMVQPVHHLTPVINQVHHLSGLVQLLVHHLVH
jgi:conjugal transfer pilus assembly protein TraA